MKISTFDDDLLGLDDFARQLERFITIERQYVDGGLVIGLSSKFGSGKSTFFQMWKSSLEKEKEENNTLIILLNAWESDYYGDPLFAIISALVDTVKKEGISAEKIIYAAKDIGLFTTVIGGQIVNKLTGIDTIAATEHVGEKKKKRNKDMLLSPDTFSMYEGRKKAMNTLREAVLEFIESNETMILFLVDELDRCRPDYAIAYLETIKHIFDIKGTVFILAADRKHLENSAKTAFGANLDFDEYYRKFVHREVSLPEISDSGYQKIASEYVKFYLKRNGARHCYLNPKDENNIISLVGSLHFTPRQIQEVFRTLGHIFETTKAKEKPLHTTLAVGTILLAILKIAKPQLYKSLGTQQLKPTDALEYFREHLKDNYAEYLFKLCLTGEGLKREENETNETIMRSVGLINEKDESTMIESQLSQLYDSGIWGHHSHFTIGKIFEKIERLDQWTRS